jgi:hypothetical protein
MPEPFTADYKIPYLDLPLLLLMPTLLPYLTSPCSKPLPAEARGEDDHKLVIVEGTVLGEGAFSRVVKVGG